MSLQNRNWPCQPAVHTPYAAQQTSFASPRMLAKLLGHTFPARKIEVAMFCQGCCCLLQASTGAFWMVVVRVLHAGPATEWHLHSCPTRTLTLPCKPLVSNYACSSLNSRSSTGLHHVFSMTESCWHTTDGVEQCHVFSVSFVADAFHRE